MVSAALMRVMGGDVAELPLVATSQDVQGLVGLRIALLLNTRLFIWSCGWFFVHWLMFDLLR